VQPEHLIAISAAGPLELALWCLSGMCGPVHRPQTVVTLTCGSPPQRPFGDRRPADSTRSPRVFTQAAMALAVGRGLERRYWDLALLPSTKNKTLSTPTVLCT
jgi:hypothetical protein